jgi:hypothetical protein
MKHYAKYFAIALLVLIGSTTYAGRDGSGNYSLPSGNPVSTGTSISSTWANTTLSDIATALTNSISKDGQTVATGNLPMGGFKHTNVADAASRNQYASAGQLQDFSTNALSSVSGTNTIIGSLNPTITAYATRMLVVFTPANANTGATTINVNGVGAKSIVKGNGTALAANDLLTTVPAVLVYDGTNFVLLNPLAALPAMNGAALTSLSAANLTGSLPAISGASLTGVLKTANNLSDVTASTARSNLGVTATGGDTTYAFRSNNLSDLGSASTARSNLGIGTGASADFYTRNITGKAGVTKTLSSSAPSGGSDGDVWYKY